MYACTVRACACPRVMDTGEKSIVARGLLITDSIFLFPHPRRKVHGFTTAFFPLLAPTKNTRASRPNEKSPVTQGNLLPRTLDPFIKLTDPDAFPINFLDYSILLRFPSNGKKLGKDTDRKFPPTRIYISRVSVDFRRCARLSIEDSLNT